MPPDWALEIEFEMRHPVSGFDQRCTAARARIGKLHTISRHAEMNLLLVGWPGPMNVGCWLISHGLSEFGLRQRFDLFGGKPKDANGTGDVFYRLLSQIGKSERQLVPDLI